MLLVTTCLFVTLAACPSGALGVWQGVFAPPWFARAIGPLHLVGYSTWNASCPPYQGCAPTRDEAYVIWVLWGSAGRQRDAHRLLSVPIEH